MPVREALDGYNLPAFKAGTVQQERQWQEQTGEKCTTVTEQERGNGICIGIRRITAITHAYQGRKLEPGYA
jgi:hypothetical protein